MIFLCFCKRVQEFATLLPEAKLGQCQPLRFDPALRKNNCCGVVHLLFLHWLGDFGMCLHFCNFCVCVFISLFGSSVSVCPGLAKHGHQLAVNSTGQRIVNISVNATVLVCYV